jgi:hypothetical protein
MRLGKWQLFTSKAEAGTGNDSKILATLSRRMKFHRKLKCSIILNLEVFFTI